MKMPIEVDVPFEKCKKCLAFDPYVVRSDYQIDKDFKVSCRTEYHCKGEKFCETRGDETDNE